MTSELEELYTSQLHHFELAKKNYGSLGQVIYRTIPLGEFQIRVQYNPARMLSTNAKVDAASIQARKCFLCPEHMPEGQQGISYGGKYRIYINPYPIFDRHFTVPAVSHTPQLLEGRFTDMLDLAFDLPGYTVFYNGPECGASAPDHFHFQMAPRHIMPLEQDMDTPQLREYLIRDAYYSVYTLRNYLREVMIITASDQHQLCQLFSVITEITGQEIPYQEEPKMNVLTWFENCQWHVCIFPRTERRPWQFSAENAGKVLFSPGCVDMAGLIIAPRPEDFEKYSASLLTDLFAQVSVPAAPWQKIIQQLKSAL